MGDGLLRKLNMLTTFWITTLTDVPVDLFCWHRFPAPPSHLAWLQDLQPLAHRCCPREQGNHKQNALGNMGNFSVMYHFNTINTSRAGLKGISASFGDVFSQSMIFSTSLSITWKLSQLRIADSKRIRIEQGSLSDKSKEICVRKKLQIKQTISLKSNIDILPMQQIFRSQTFSKYDNVCN